MSNTYTAIVLSDEKFQTGLVPKVKDELSSISNVTGIVNSFGIDKGKGKNRFAIVLELGGSTVLRATGFSNAKIDKLEDEVGNFLQGFNQGGGGTILAAQMFSSDGRWKIMIIYTSNGGNTYSDSWVKGNDYEEVQESLIGKLGNTANGNNPNVSPFAFTYGEGLYAAVYFSS